jgi:hypothetical protein
MIRLLACFTLLVFGSSLHAQDKTLGPAPNLVILGKLDPQKGTFGLMLPKCVTYPETETYKVNVQGREEVRNRTVYKQIFSIAEASQQMKDHRIHTTQGRVLAIDEAWHKLKSGSAVVLSSNDQLPDAEYLAAMRPDTLVIVPLKK